MAIPVPPLPRFGSSVRHAVADRGREAEALRGRTAVDGSFLPARPRMAWAVWRDETHRAARRHLALDLDADRIGLAYQYRWSVEPFFRWLTCLLGCRHRVAAGRNGVTIPVYVARVASRLVALWTGRVPTQRTWVMIRRYVLGWATRAEVEADLAAQARKAGPKKTPVGSRRA